MIDVAAPDVADRRLEKVEPPPILSIEELSLSYATSRGPLHALDRVSFAIPRGRALGLVGESGSGKSSVVLAMLGLLDATAQVTARHAIFDGEDLLAAALRLRGRRIGVVFQDPAAVLNPALTIGLQVAEPLMVHLAMPRAAAFERATALLAEVGLPRPAQIIESYPHQLSGGMKQRVAIATALAVEPDLLLLDEPTTALDVTVEAQILDLLESLRARRRLSMLLVSHNLGIVDRICDRLTVLYAGRTVESGPTTRLLAEPRHPYTRGLLAALPRPDRPRGKRLAPIAGSLPNLLDIDPGCNFRSRCTFAAAGCELPQPWLPIRADWFARCHRTEAIAKLSAPAAAAAACQEERAGEKPQPALVVAKNLTRIFHQRGFLAGLPGLAKLLGTRRHAPVKAVDDVSLTIRTGEIVGLVGESGSGKSTLARLILRLLPADAGTVVFDGAAVGARPDAAFRRRAQIVFQNPDTSLNPRKTVGATLRRPLDLFGYGGDGSTETEIRRLLDLVRLPHSYCNRYPHQLSGGEKQRVAIARALATRPDFLVCDEAVSALDVSVQAAILNLLCDLRDELGVAYLFISHDIGVIAHIADRIAVMYGGTIVEEGAAADVLHPPYHPYTEALLSSVPIVGARHRQALRVRLAGDHSASATADGCLFAPRCPRRLGALCDTVKPPWQQSPDGHRIACHIPLSQLSAVEPVLHSPAPSLFSTVP